MDIGCEHHYCKQVLPSFVRQKFGHFTLLYLSSLGSARSACSEQPIMRFKRLVISFLIQQRCPLQSTITASCISNEKVALECSEHYIYFSAHIKGLASELLCLHIPKRAFILVSATASWMKKLCCTN